MDFYPKFKWAVPVAFSRALCDCYFEEGDTFYDNRIAYQKSWEEAQKRIQFCITVTYPTQTKINLPENVKTGKFKHFWATELKLQLEDFKNKTIKKIDATQGGLYLLLWKGNFNLLTNQSADIEPPILVTDVNSKSSGMLEIKLDYFANMYDEWQSTNLFIFAHDPTNKVSEKKYRDIKEILSDNFEIIEKSLSPGKTTLLNNEPLNATTSFFCFYIKSKNPKNIESALKKVLYKPIVKTKKSSDKPQQDKYSLRRHGYFVPYNDKRLEKLKRSY